MVSCCDANESAERIFVVDDDHSVRQGLERLLRAQGYRVETFATGGEFLARPPCQGTGCVLLDIRMPGLSGLQLQEALAATGEELPVIFITGLGGVSECVQAMKGGALDFLIKPIDMPCLCGAVERALSKHRDLRRVRQRADCARALLQGLTNRERAVLARVAAGRLNKQIADEFGISLATVKAHRGRVMRKLQADSVADLVHFSDLIQGPDSTKV
jgi:FixJ family two-component response regulator